MRQAFIMASCGVVVVALAAIGGSTIVANAPKQHAASAASWVGVMDPKKRSTPTDWRTLEAENAFAR